MFFFAQLILGDDLDDERAGAIEIKRKLHGYEVGLFEINLLGEVLGQIADDLWGYERFAAGIINAHENVDIGLLAGIEGHIDNKRMWRDNFRRGSRQLRRDADEAENRVLQTSKAYSKDLASFARLSLTVRRTLCLPAFGCCPRQR